MSYYQSPMGDYKTYGYAGDPGFLSSLWKGVKKIATFIPGPIGTIARVAGAVGVATAGAKILTPPALPQSPSYPGPAFPAVGYVPPLRGQFPAMGARGPSSPGWVPPAAGGACPSGYHLAKDGSGRMVRNRRMNVANPRALRRAIRRTDGFVKLAKRALKGTGYAVRRA